MPAAKVKQYVQATRDPKSLHAPLHKNNDKNTGAGESLVDTLAAEESDDEEAVEHARCITRLQQACSMTIKHRLKSNAGL